MEGIGQIKNEAHVLSNSPGVGTSRMSEHVVSSRSFGGGTGAKPTV